MHDVQADPASVDDTNLRMPMHDDSEDEDDLAQVEVEEQEVAGTSPDDDGVASKSRSENVDADLEYSTASSAADSASSDEDGSSGDSSTREETKAAMELGKLGARVLELERKLDSFERRYQTALSRSVMVHWGHGKIKRKLAFDDHLDAQRLRTQAGNVVTELTSVLLKLDAIESHGNKTIRAARRGLVLKLTNTDLPRAEKDFKRAGHLVGLDSRLRAAKVPVAEHNSESGSDSDSDGDKMMADGNETEVVSGSVPVPKPETTVSSDPESPPVREPQPEQSPKRDTSSRLSPHMNHCQQDQHCDGGKTFKRRAPLEHDVREGQDMVAIYVGARDRQLALEDASVQVDRASGELQVIVRGYETQKFDVTHQMLLPLQTSYKIERGVLVIKIPKRQQYPTATRFVRQAPQAYQPRRHGFNGFQGHPVYHQRTQPVSWFY